MKHYSAPPPPAIYIIPTEAISLSGLDYESQTKVFAIYELARLCHQFKKDPISPSEFDDYYDMDIDSFMSLLNTIRDVYIREAHKSRGYY